MIFLIKITPVSNTFYFLFKFITITLTIDFFEFTLCFGLGFITHDFIDQC
jgi:hypothetical protein